MADAERQAGVFEWSDFGAEDTMKYDLRTPLERRNSAEYRKTAKWLQNALIGIAGNADVIVLALVQRVVVLERVAADDGRYKLIAEFSASDGFSNNSASFTSLLMAFDSINSLASTSLAECCSLNMQ
uniref:Uncharacterized protein n=1 Tax=Parascaris equorum TaxID=6256 RepID=A0A914RSD3_PAREQ